jgi:cob(I)alamin adenosyltransferase
VRRKRARIYTRAGDRGRTGLAGGRRVRKSHPRIVALGEVDELNAQIGLVLAHGVDDPVRPVLHSIQHRLFELGAVLAGSGGDVTRLDAGWLESEIDRLDAGLEPLRAFVLPGGTKAAAQCHVARAVCRRAERAVVALACREPVPHAVPVFLNRLSDLLFVAARALNHAAGAAEPSWRKGLE